MLSAALHPITTSDICVTYNRDNIPHADEIQLHLVLHHQVHSDAGTAAGM
jgi:hypothetical protein